MEIYQRDVHLTRQRFGIKFPNCRGIGQVLRYCIARKPNSSVLFRQSRQCRVRVFFGAKKWGGTNDGLIYLMYVVLCGSEQLDVLVIQRKRL